MLSSVIARTTADRYDSHMDGFLPFSRAPLMIDVIACSLLVIVPVSAWAVWQARQHRRYHRHRHLQTSLFLLLALAVGLFEWELQVVNWRELAAPSPYFGEVLDTSLRIHLVFAISTSIAWVVTVPLAWWGFSNPPSPGSHSRWHRWLGRTALVGLTATTITGWTFYLLAFVA